MSREYTAIPHEYLEEMDTLSDAEFGRLIRALLEYSMTGEERELSGGERVHWKRVRNRENRYQESFADNEKGKTERARNAANARWSNAKNANACTSIPSNAKNANTNTKTKAKANTEAKDIFAAFAAGDEDLLRALRDFETMRKEIKKPMTDRARSGLCSKLEKISANDHGSMIRILDQSIMNCWQDVYALKEPQKQQGASGGNPFLEMLGVEDEHTGGNKAAGDDQSGIPKRLQRDGQCQPDRHGEYVGYELCRGAVPDHGTGLQRAAYDAEVPAHGGGDGGTAAETAL